MHQSHCVSATVVNNVYHRTRFSQCHRRFADMTVVGLAPTAKDILTQKKYSEGTIIPKNRKQLPAFKSQNSLENIIPPMLPRKRKAPNPTPDQNGTKLLPSISNINLKV